MNSWVPNRRGGWNSREGWKNPQNLFSERGVGINGGGGWKMTTNVVEKATVSYHKLCVSK